MKIKNKVISVLLAVFMLASAMPNLIVSAEATSELQNIYYKLTVDKTAKIGYLGGSITEGYLATTPWPTLLGNWFGEKFPDAEITNVNAGIGGTGSKFGAYRAYRDLKIAEGAPDMVFIEFAMNDLYLGMDEAQTKRYYESIIQRIYQANPNCQIISLFTTDIYTKGGDCDNRTWQKEIADYYGIKSINIGEALWNKIVEENGGTEPANTNDATWKTYFNDYVHPTDAGHAVYAETIEEYLDEQLIGDTVTRDETTYNDLSSPAQGTDLITDGNSANFTEAGFYKLYTPGWILKATNSNEANISNDILAWAGNAKLAFEFTGTSAGFYNESIGSDGNLSYTVTRKSDGAVMSENTVNINGRALTLFADNLDYDTYKVEVTSDKNRRFRYVVYSGSSLSICEDRPETELIANNVVHTTFDQFPNLSYESTTKDDNSVVKLTPWSGAGTNEMYAHKWALRGNNIYMADYRYAKVEYYYEYPEDAAEKPQIGFRIGGAAGVDSGGAEHGLGNYMTLKEAKTNVWATTVFDLLPDISSWMKENPLDSNINRYFFFPFGKEVKSNVPDGAVFYLKSITLMPNYTANEGDVTLSFVSGFASAEGTAPETLSGDTSSVFTLPANPFAKEGYEFLGWQINGTIYQPGSRFTSDSAGDYTAYAMWSKVNDGETSKVAYVNTSGSIDTDGNGQPDLKVYKRIADAYEYFAEIGGDDTGIIYISGDADLPSDTSAARGKVLIRGLGDTSEDIANNKLTKPDMVKLQEDMTLDYLTLSNFNAKCNSPNGHTFTYGEHLKADGNITAESDIPNDSAAGGQIINAPNFIFNAPDLTYGYVQVARNGTIGTVNGTANYVFNTGTFQSVCAGSWLWAMKDHTDKINLNYNANYVFNGGKYTGGIYTGSRFEVGINGNVVYTVNGGTFGSGKTISFGHTSSGQGYAGYNGVKNAAVIFNNKQIALNGGSVNGLKVDHKTGNTEMPAEGAEIVVVNNAEIDNGLVLDSALASTHRIKVMNGSAVPVFEDTTGGALLGFTITSDNAKTNAVYLNDTEIFPDENGLYQIAADTTAGEDGIRTISFKQNLYAVVNDVQIPVADQEDGSKVIAVTEDGTIDLSNAVCADKDNAYFIGWKNAEGNYVVTGATVAAGDTLTAVYIGANALTVSAKVLTSPNALRYNTSIDADILNTLNGINNVGQGSFTAPETDSDTGIGYGTIIIANMPTGTELTKETDGASVIPAVSVQDNSYSADSPAVADADIENSVFKARSYITYTDTLGETHTIYSDVFDKTLYQVAALEYVDEATSEETKQYLLENILDVASRVGNPFSNTAKVIQRDNKLTIGYIGGSITNGYSAGSPSIRLRGQNGKYNYRWANGDEIQLTDEKLNELGGVINNWGNWNLSAMPMYYDENGVKYTQEEADFQEYTWDSDAGEYVAGDYLKVLPDDISKNWVNRINGWFEEKFPGVEIESVNVGISGTASNYGAARIEKDLLYSDGHDVPDLVFIEFTINDWLYSSTDNTDGLSQTSDDLKRQVESMLLSIWKANPYAEVALIYTASETAPTSKLHTEVANYYNIPYSDVGSRMGEAKQARLAKIRPDKPNTWYENSMNKDLYYTVDNLHPSIIGYGLYFEDIKEDLLDKYITNDMTYGTTLYNYAEAHEDMAPAAGDWSMLNPTQIPAEDFTWTGTQATGLAGTEWNFWSGPAWTSTADCGYDYQLAPAVKGTMYYTARNNSGMGFPETPSSIHVTSNKAQASFDFTGRAFGFMFKTMYHNIDMEYQLDGGEWKKFRIAADNKFGSLLYENSNFVFAEQDLEQGHHTVNLRFNNSGGRTSAISSVTADTNEVNIYLGSVVYFSDTAAEPSPESAEITGLIGLSETGLNVHLVEPETAAQVIVAVRDSSGALLSLNIEDVTGSEMSFEITVPQDEGTTVEAMMWEDMGTMKPIGSAKTAVMTKGNWIVK